VRVREEVPEPSIAVYREGIPRRSAITTSLQSARRRQDGILSQPLRRLQARLPSPLLLLVALLAGCTGLRVRPTPPRTVPPEAVSAESLLRGVDNRSASLHSFRALADMHYVGPKDKLAVKEIVVVERPDRLRIEMMSAFGVALQIASDGQHLSAYHRGERTYYRGKATPDNLARFTRLELDLRDVADLLIGLPPGRLRLGRASIAFEPPLGFWRVTTALAGGGSQTMWFDPDTLLTVRAEETDRRGTVLYKAAYSNYTTVSGVPIPREVRFEVPEQSAKIDLRYSEISLNGQLPLDLFSFAAPPGSKIVDLDDVASQTPG
jgi:outer membrane lipoprotein-sorting protein